MGGKFGQWWGDLKDEVDDTWDDIQHGDYLSIVERNFKGGLATITLGMSNWLVDDIRKLNDPPDMPNNMAQAEDRKITHRSTVGPREIVYGKVKKGGNVVYIESSGTNDEYLHLIIVLAAHPCDHISSVYFGDLLIGSDNGFDTDNAQLFTIDQNYDEKVVMFAQLGAHTAVYSGISAIAPASWTANHKLLGQTFLYVRLQYDRGLFRDGVPNFSVTMVGKNDLFDPRNDSTGYSKNHALCVLDYLRWSHGMNIPDAEIDMASFEAAADISSEVVDTKYQWWGGGETEARYLVDGVLQINKPPLKNLEELLRAGGAGMTFYQGKWRIIPAAYTAPTLSFNESDLIGGIQFTPSSGKAGRLNTVKGAYVNPYDNWEVTDYAQMQIAAYVANDLEVLEGNINHSLITSGYRAQRLAKLAIERSRYGLTVSATFKFNALELSIGDRLSLSISALGWSGKTFLVLDMGINFAGGVSLMLREDASAIYTWDTSDAVEIIQPPTVNLPDPNPILPTGLAITEELYATNIVRDIKARAMISWTDPGREQHYDVQYKLSADSVWKWVQSGFAGLATTVEDITPETYDFRIRGLNSLGWSTDWATEANVVIEGKTTPPPDVSSLVIDRYILSWSYPNAPLDLAGFEIRVRYDGDVTWDDATQFHAGIITASAYDVSGVIGITTFLVKAIDTSGNYSAGAAALLIELADIVDITLSYSGGNAVLTWPENTSAIKSVITVLEYDSSIIQETFGNSFIVPITWAGSRLFIVRASLLPGYWGADTEIIINPAAPGTPTVTARVIANNVVFNYSSVAGSLAIDRFEIRRGGTYDGNQVPVNKAGTSTFTIFEEAAAGTIVFWFEAVDVAGNHSGHVSISVQVSNPPNYQLLANFSAKDLSWPGTMTNCFETESGNMLLPVNTTETWGEHFTDNSFDAPQDQIDAGFEYYMQPSMNTAQYIVTFDYLSVIDSAIISANTAPIVLDGGVTVAVQIDFSEDNSTWTEGTAGATQIQGTDFRYVRVTLDFTAAGGDDLAYVEDVLVKLDKQVDEDFGRFSAVSTDATGTRVYFNKDFIDAQTPSVSVSSTERISVIIDYDDVPDPEYFDVYVFSVATGNRISADGSWHVYGFTRIA